MRNVTLLAVIYVLILGAGCTSKSKDYAEVSLELVELNPNPIIKAGDPGTENNKYGYEGGTAYKVGNRYYIFSTEVFDDPKTANVRMVLWESDNGNDFSKTRIIAKSNGDWNDSTYRMAPWSPMAVFDDELNRWSIFHVGYKRKPNATDPWNMSGRIHRYDSEKKGMEGISGPYVEGEWLNISKKGDDWEGPAELVSFFPYKVGKEWYAFYGSNSASGYIDPISKPQDNNSAKILFWVGLAKASNLTGEWKRISEKNPVLMDPEFIENPIVTKINDNLYLVVYDGGNKHAISYSWSRDGIEWQKEQLIQLPNAPEWLNAIRTPLGLIDEGNNEFTLYFTAFDGINPNKDLPLWHDGFGNIGKVKVKLELK